MSVLSRKEVEAQSWSAYNQHKDKWRLHAQISKELGTRSLSELNDVGLGKVMVMVATGASLEKQMPLLKKYKDKIDIFTCDKSLGLLLDNDIKPNYVLVADANVSYEKYCEPWIEKTEDINLVTNACANPDWMRNWRGDIFSFVNKDAINSEKEFIPLSGNSNIIPASSNVSNAMVVMATQCDERGPRNAWGYAKYLLVGYDYSWHYNGNYYAYTDCEKRCYMNHMQKVDMNGDFVMTSNNLLFSAKWLYTYLTTFKLSVFNCSETGLLVYNMSKLERELKSINCNYEKIDRLKKIWKQRNKLIRQVKAIEVEVRDLQMAY